MNKHNILKEIDVKEIIIIILIAVLAIFSYNLGVYNTLIVKDWIEQNCGIKVFGNMLIGWHGYLP